MKPLFLSNQNPEVNHLNTLETTMAPSSVGELLRRTEITCKARYHAARRMSFHGSFSQWTLALLAVGQIVISLVAVLELHSNFRPAYTSFASVFFGVLVLAYSLLLGMANYSARAVKLHECGLGLGRLARELTFLSAVHDVAQAQYEAYAARYYDILDKHENHTRADYLVAHYEYYGRYMSITEGISWVWCVRTLELTWVLIRIYLWHVSQFAHYVLSVGLVYGWIYALVRR